MQKIILCGSKGKCGSAVYELLKQENFEILACVNENEMTLHEAIKKYSHIDYVIDFTKKDVAYMHIQLCIQYHIPFICGTTGFSQNELEAIKLACKESQLKGIICSNFSLPLNCIIKEFPTLCQSFDEVNIIEEHHKSKLDRPSGTGKMLLKMATCKSQITSLDREDFVIYYRLQFESKYDKMEIAYEVDSKQVYAKGVLYYLLNEENHFFINLIE